MKQYGSILAKQYEVKEEKALITYSTVSRPPALLEL